MVFQKGHKPWNIGLTNWHIGKKNPMYGRPQTKETKDVLRKQKLGKSYEQIYGKEGARKLKQKRREQMKGDKNPAKKVEVRIKLSNSKRKNWRDGVYDTSEYRKKLSTSQIGLQAGDKNPRWRGGISFEPYGIGFNKQLKDVIRKRDNHICQLCGCFQGKNKLCIHHGDYNKKNNDPENLISLCKSCHGKTGINREYWANFFS